MSVRPIAPSVPEDAYAAEVWDDESPATASTGGQEGPPEVNSADTVT